MERYYRTRSQLILPSTMRLIKLSEGDDYGLYVGRNGGRNSFGTPLMLRGTRDEVITFLSGMGLTGKLELP